ncbi:hypothetical protein [Sphingopyxis sp.]|uniref:hypothetical protein n=1 Tax=Sphingopyxis sp. TaxID=1908224 RepID=UPI002EDB7DFA
MTRRLGRVSGYRSSLRQKKTIRRTDKAREALGTSLGQALRANVIGEPTPVRARLLELEPASGHGVPGGSGTQVTRAYVRKVGARRIGLASVGMVEIKVTGSGHGVSLGQPSSLAMKDHIFWRRRLVRPGMPVKRIGLPASERPPRLGKISLF